MTFSRYPYLPIINRPRLEWPDGKQLAFYIGLNIEYYNIDAPTYEVPASPHPQVGLFSGRDYGARIGIFRMMDVMDKFSARASVLLNADVCREYPAIIEEGVKRNWEWLGHGLTNNSRMTDYAVESERDIIHQVKETIIAATGRAPRGWLGPALTETANTPDHLAAEGFDYVCDWGCDDQPIPMRVESGRLLAMPYSQGLNDRGLLANNVYTGPQFLQAFKDAFDVLYEEGATNARIMALPLHPFVIGKPTLIRYLREILEYVTAHDKVWVTTAGEIADWYYSHYFQSS